MQTRNTGCNGVFEANQGSVPELLQQLFATVMLAKTGTCDQPLKARVRPTPSYLDPVGGGKSARLAQGSGVHLGQFTEAKLGINHVERPL